MLDDQLLIQKWDIDSIFTLIIGFIIAYRNSIMHQNVKDDNLAE